VDTRRATEDSAGVLEQYVEESEGMQRSRHGALFLRSMKLAQSITNVLGDTLGCEKCGSKKSCNHEIQ
jgi:hypothetical protein